MPAIEDLIAVLAYVGCFVYSTELKVCTKKGHLYKMKLSQWAHVCYHEEKNKKFKIIVLSWFPLGCWMHSGKPMEKCWVIKKYIQLMQLKFHIHCLCTLAEKCFMNWTNTYHCCNYCSERLFLGKVVYGQIIKPLVSLHWNLKDHFVLCFWSKPLTFTYQTISSKLY